MSKGGVIFRITRLLVLAMHLAGGRPRCRVRCGDCAMACGTRGTGEDGAQAYDSLRQGVRDGRQGQGPRECASRAALFRDARICSGLVYGLLGQQPAGEERRRERERGGSFLGH